MRPTPVTLSAIPVTLRSAQSARLEGRVMVSASVTLRSAQSARLEGQQTNVARLRVLRCDDASRRSLHSLLSMTAQQLRLGMTRLCHPEERCEASRLEGPRTNVARLRVLRFDDASRRSLRSLLSMTGQRLRPSMTGQRALSAANATRPSLVTLRSARSARLEGRARNTRLRYTHKALIWNS